MSADEEWVPGDKSELMSSICHEWDRLMDVVEKLRQAGRMTMSDAGGWSPKDNLAHLAEWMNILMGYHLNLRPAHEVIGVSEDVTKDWNIDVINPLLFERNKDRSVDDVLDWLKDSHAKLIEKLDGMPFDDLLEPRHAEDPEKQPLLMFVMGNTTWHFAEHCATIEKMLK